MGADLYLMSYEPQLEEAMKHWESDFPSSRDPQVILRAVEASYAYQAAIGGYFRNGYNAGDVMWAMGLSWSRDVGPMVDDEGCLPLDHAQRLIDMIEARPLGRSEIAKHYLEHMTNGKEEHPLTGPMLEAMRAGDNDSEPEHLLPPDFDELAEFLTGKQTELLAILRKSVGLGEPLRCSV
jgi:hypothetical protein